MREKLPRPDRPDYFAECHHIYGGSRRKFSEEYNCIVYLPYAYHRGNNGVHHNKVYRLFLQARGQADLENIGWTREEFIETFGRNYL